MAPYVIVPMPELGNPSNYCKLILPIETLNILKSSKEWSFSPTDCDAFSTDYNRSLPWVNSLRTRAKLYGKVEKNNNVWDFRDCGNNGSLFDIDALKSIKL
jgi:hypothetical protein